jgi:hypothetical protein
VVPKQRRFERIDLIERLLQPATSAICAAESVPETIISWIMACCDAARFGAMLSSGIDRVVQVAVMGEGKVSSSLDSRTGTCFNLSRRRTR